MKYLTGDSGALTTFYWKIKAGLALLGADSHARDEDGEESTENQLACDVIVRTPEMVLNLFKRAARARWQASAVPRHPFIHVICD